MDLRQLGYFVAMVEGGSISAAARELLISQPSLTVVLRNLEREMGTPLLVRTAKGTTPTESGRFLYESARRILKDAESTTEHLRSMAAGKAGHLALAITPSYGWGFLPGVLDRLGVAAPDIQVELHDPPPLGIIQEVEVGAADLGIVATHDYASLRASYRDDFAMVRLCEIPVVALLPADECPDGRPVRLDELRDRPWVVPMSSPGFPGLAALITEIWVKAGWKPKVIRKVSTSQTSLPIVAGNLGIALMPDTVASLATSGVTTRPLVEDITPLTAVLLCRRGRPLSPAARLFLDLARDLHGTASTISEPGAPPAGDRPPPSGAAGSRTASP